METTYLLLKFLHVLGAIAWIGGLLMLLVLNARMGREGEATVVAALGRQSEYLGRSVLGPAMLLTLLAGFGTAGVARFPFSSLWIVWGSLALSPRSSSACCWCSGRPANWNRPRGRPVRRIPG